MSGSRKQSRKTKRQVRMPATKLAHLQKRLRQAAKPVDPNVKKKP